MVKTWLLPTSFGAVVYVRTFKLMSLTAPMAPREAKSRSSTWHLFLSSVAAGGNVPLQVLQRKEGYCKLDPSIFYMSSLNGDSASPMFQARGGQGWGLAKNSRYRFRGMGGLTGAPSSGYEEGWHDTLQRCVSGFEQGAGQLSFVSSRLMCTPGLLWNNPPLLSPFSGQCMCLCFCWEVISPGLMDL